MCLVILFMDLSLCLSRYDFFDERVQILWAYCEHSWIAVLRFVRCWLHCVDATACFAAKIGTRWIGGIRKDFDRWRCTKALKIGQRTFHLDTKKNWPPGFSGRERARKARRLR